MVELVVVEKMGPDVIARSIEEGLILSRANVTCRCGRCLGGGAGRGGGGADPDRAGDGGGARFGVLELIRARDLLGGGPETRKQRSNQRLRSALAAVCARKLRG